MVESSSSSSSLLLSPTLVQLNSTMEQIKIMIKLESNVYKCSNYLFNKLHHHHRTPPPPSPPHCRNSRRRRNPFEDCPIVLQKAAMKECIQFINCFIVDDAVPVTVKKKKDEDLKRSNEQNNISSSFFFFPGKKLSSPTSVAPTTTTTTTDNTAMEGLQTLSEKEEEEEEEEEEELGEWRERMVFWSYEIVDYYKINRECVAVAFSFVDRYQSLSSLSSSSSSSSFSSLTNPSRRKLFQLLVMTSLYLAIKLNESSRRKLTLNHMISIGKNENSLFYTKEAFIFMEQNLLQTLSWRVHPPIAQNYIYLLFDFLQFHTSNNNDDDDDDEEQQQQDQQQRMKFYHICRSYIEWAVTDSFVCISKSQWIIALAAMDVTFTKMALSSLENKNEMIYFFKEQILLRCTDNNDDIEKEVKLLSWYFEQFADPHVLEF